MRKRRIIPTALVIFASLGPLTGFAQTSFSTTNKFSGPGTYLWDPDLIFGAKVLWFTFPKGFGGGATNTSLACATPFTVDGGGKLKGSGATQMWLIEDESRTNILSGSYDSKGSISSAGKFARVVGTIKATGQGMLNGASREVSAFENYSVVFDPGNWQYSVGLSERVTASGLGTLWNPPYRSGPYTISPEFGDGSWTLVLNVTNPVGKKLSGTATVSLTTGKVFPFLVNGAFSPDNAVLRLHLKGYDAANGSFLNLVSFGTQIQRISGRLSGQSVRYPPPPSAPKPPNSPPPNSNPDPGGSGSVDVIMIGPP